MNAGKLFSVEFLWFEVAVGQILHAIGVLPGMLGMARGDILCLTNVDFFRHNGIGNKYQKEALVLCVVTWLSRGGASLWVHALHPHQLSEEKGAVVQWLGLLLWCMTLVKFPY